MLAFTHRERKLPEFAGRVVAAGLLGAALLGLGANVHPYQPVAPRWSEADLAVADTSNNAWSLLDAEVDLEIPSELRALVDAEETNTALFWPQVDEQADLLHEFLATPAALEAQALVEAIRERPTFEDAAGASKVIPWLKLHRVALLQAIELARTDALADSTTLLCELIRVDRAHLESARSLISFVVALEDLGATLSVADGIARHVEQDPRALALLAPLAPALRSVDVEAIDLERVVVGEYVALVDMLDDFEGGSGDLLELTDMPEWTRWLYSRPLTLRGLNERFEARYVAASAHDTHAALGVGERSPKQAIGWWVRNAVGASFLAAGTADFASLASSIEQDIARLGRTRADLLARLKPVE